MRAVKTRQVIAALATPLLLATMSGCSKGAEADDSKADASSSPSSEDSATPADDGGYQPLAGDELAATLVKNRGAEPYRFKMVSSFSGKTTTMTAELIPDGDQGNSHMTVVAGSKSKVDIITIGYTVYVDSGTGTYLKSTVDKEAVPQNDPDAMITSFTTNATYTGEEQLDGETVQHYSSKLIGPDAAVYGGEADVELYVDDKTRLTYFTITSSLGEVTYDMFDFGATDIVVKAPPKNKVKQAPA